MLGERKCAEGDWAIDGAFETGEMNFYAGEMDWGI